MKQSRHLRLLAAVAIAIVAALPASLFSQKIFALSGGSLVSFDASTPAVTLAVGVVTGIAAGQTLVGIDFRPQTGELYGLGYNSATGEARLYTLNLSTAAATAIGAGPVSVAPGMGEVSFDFNPTVDRIRLMGSNNQNYRLHPVTGALAATDGSLAFAATDVNALADPEIGTGAYLNSYIAATSTTLFNYDAKLNVLTSQNPPNNGTQNTIGASGITVDAGGGSVSMDGYFNTALGVNQFFLAANTGGSANDDLYSINTATGAATLVGPIGMPVRDIAAQIIRSVPPLTGDLAWALTSTNWLTSFDAASPATIRTSAPVTGIATGQSLVGMDFRPATGELFALGYNSATGEARLYTIKTSTAAATAIGSANITLAANLGKVGMDFNPTVDRIRVTASGNQNYRLHPITGGIAATDAMLNFNTGDANFGKNPSVGASGYTNSFAGATTTTLFNYDDSLNVLVSQVPPNDGKLNTIGASGIAVNLADPTSDIDIFWDKTTATNRAFLMANTGTSNFDNLYSLNTSTGAATSIGRIGNGSAFVDLAIAIAPRVALFCPANITVNAAAGAGGAVATYTAPGAATGCEGGLTGAPTKLSGGASGDFFPGGVNTVCFSASDACNNQNSCCFTITVNETPCSQQTVGSIKFEILSVKFDAKKNKVMRVKVTNNSASPLVYAAFQVQNGTTAVAPANNAVFTANSGNKYTVRNPNYSPLLSIKFTANGTGIMGGASEVFEYTLPKLTSLNYHSMAVRTADGAITTALVSIFKCPATLLGGSSEELFSEEEAEGFFTQKGTATGWMVAPNPSSGALMADLSPFEGAAVEVSIFDFSGKKMGGRSFEPGLADGPADLSDLTENLPNGLYFIEMRSSDGQKEVAKWLLQR